MKAYFVKRDSGYRGDARLYRMDPPLPYDGFEYNDADEYVEVEKHAPYVVVSAVDVPYSGPPRTYIFPADEHGEIVSWGELPGSFRGALDHEQALADAGYTVVMED